VKLLWPEKVMLESLEVLNRLKAIGIPSVVIGGWAVYLMTRYHMSRDLDLIIEEKDLWKLRSFVIAEGGTSKAPGLNKYGYRLGSVDMDVYTEEKGDILPSPTEILGQRRYVDIEGFRVVEPEILFLLKLRAAGERSGGLKGLKDRCDLISLLNSGKIDLGKLADEARRWHQGDVLRQTKEMVQAADVEFDYVLGKTTLPRERWNRKRQLIRILREAILGH